MNNNRSPIPILLVMFSAYWPLFTKYRLSKNMTRIFC